MSPFSRTGPQLGRVWCRNRGDGRPLPRIAGFRGNCARGRIARPCTPALGIRRRCTRSRSAADGDRDRLLGQPCRHTRRCARAASSRPSPDKAALSTLQPRTGAPDLWQRTPIGFRHDTRPRRGGPVDTQRRSRWRSRPGRRRCATIVDSMASRDCRSSEPNFSPT